MQPEAWLSVFLVFSNYSTVHCIVNPMNELIFDKPTTRTRQKDTAHSRVRNYACIGLGASKNVAFSLERKCKGWGQVVTELRGRLAVVLDKM